MGQSKKISISEDNFCEWAASTGVLFPQNPVELNRFDKLYSDYEYQLKEDCVDPFAIIRRESTPVIKTAKIDSEEKPENFKMAARNLDHLPEHILKKLKRNQNGKAAKDTGVSE